MSFFLLGHGGNADPGLFHKQSITEHAYYNTILPESTGKPYLIMFYSDWCFTCMRLEPIWSKLTEELEPVGFGIVTVHAGRQRELTRKIGSNELPHIALLLGSIIYYLSTCVSIICQLDEWTWVQLGSNPWLFLVLISEASKMSKKK